MSKKNFTNAIKTRDTIQDPLLTPKVNNVNNVNTENTANTGLTKNKIMRTFRIEKEIAEELKNKTYDFRMSQAEIIENALKEILENHPK